MEEEKDLERLVEKLKRFESVHSIILFGSLAGGKARKESDIDICLIEQPGRGISLEDKIEISSELPERVDLSFFYDLPLNLRRRVLKEGRVLYSEDRNYIYRLIKEVNFEFPKYRRFQEEYHKTAMKRAVKKVK